MNRPSSTEPSIDELIGRLLDVRAGMLAAGREHAGLLRDVAAPFIPSACNLLHYTALRRHDLRETQHALARLGLSSLGRCERWVLGNIDAVIDALHALRGTTRPATDDPDHRLDLDEGERLINDNAVRLLGHEPARRVRIMVTMPLEGAGNYVFIRDILAAGMDCMRINCAHGSQDEWQQLLDHLAEARRELAMPCCVFMDLAGPNPRTSIPGGELETLFKPGDRFVIAADPNPVAPHFGDASLPIIACSLPQLIRDLAPGHRLLINEGKIATKVIETTTSASLVEVTRSSLLGKKLKTEKGINLPDTHLQLESLTGRDLEILPFIASHADMVGYSFVRDAHDIGLLQDELARCGGHDVGIVLKIETVPAFRQLPRLLLAAMRSPKAGVMIARGDMAIEAGFERLAEVQEEMLWYCEAAHIPVIWATQVLETYVKKGLPGRGEITDAAMGGRAECVMLNKGPYILEAVRTLDDILLRMRAHQDKKRHTFRPLAVSEAFFETMDA